MSKRILSIVFTLCMVFMLVPQTVFAEGETGSTPSVTAYATKEQLMYGSFAPDSNSGTAANIGRLVFGKNESGDPQEWYILGGDSEVTGGANNTIIFAASPIATEKVFDGSSTNDNKKYDSGKDGIYPSDINTIQFVFPNHYGASELRKMLKDMVEEGNTTYFTKTEKELMNFTTVTTRDEKKNNGLVSYTTTDKLYALARGDDSENEKIIKAGTGNQTALNMDDYWEQASGTSNFWLRTGADWKDQAYYATWASDGPTCSKDNFDNVMCCYDVRPASNLNLSSVLFASGATASSSEIVSGLITPGTAMTLRWNGTNENIGTVIYNNTTGAIAACKDENAAETVSLVVQGKEGDNDWYYSVPVEGTIVVTAEQIKDAIETLSTTPELPELKNCKIWLETTIDNVTYAKNAEANGFSVQYVDSVAVTDMNSPVVGNIFDTEASCNTTGIATTTPAITYSTTGGNGEVKVTGNADWNTTYKGTFILATYMDMEDNNENTVVYAFGDSVSATVDGVTLTDNFKPNPDGTLTVTKEFVTAKRKIISVTVLSAPRTFTTYYGCDGYADVLSNGGNRELGKQATVTLEGIANVASITEKMNVTWMIANTNGAPYDITPGAANTFRWTIHASAFSNYDATDCANYDSGTDSITGTVTITNKAAPMKGTVLPDTKSKAKYTVTKGGSYGAEVCYTKSTDKNATSVTIPATVKMNGVTYKVTAIADNAFANSKKITKVTIGGNVKTIGKKAFYKCTKLKTVKLGKNVTAIGSNAFYGCSKLTGVTIGSNVTTISDKAFYKCTSLTRITIPSKVKKIGKQAFYGCKKLKSVTIKTTKLTSKNVGGSAFKGIYSKATIKVPKKKLVSYKKLLKSKGFSSKVTVKGY